MIITCPHCQTKYQVTYEAIGSAGRKVQCAHCHRAWDQSPNLADLADKAGANSALADIDEDALDEAVSTEERSVAVERALEAASSAGEKKPVPNAAELEKRQAAFSKRRSVMISRLPLARLRRASRIVGVLILAGLVSGAYFGRVTLVERYPDLAGLYDSIGLGVNVVGLEFSDLGSLKTLSGGNDVLLVSAQIVGVSNAPVPVPSVLVSLLGEDGRAVYEWSVTPRVRDLMAGERATFDTRLSLPPGDATRVRLRFAGGSAQVERNNNNGSAGANVSTAPQEHP
jgi:predicted Zn finger-like uncharacterized protein